MIYLIPNLLRDLLRTRTDLLLENMALRQKINVLRRNHPKPAFSRRDRLFWVALCHCWRSWRRPLALVKPETVITWHRRAWRRWWRWKSRAKEAGRPRVPWEVIKLIKRISRENPTWGAPRIHGELMMLGYWVSESTIMFRTVYVFVVLSLDRRRIFHFNVTTRPTAVWTARAALPGH
jgi:hypothetical protein